MFHSFERVERPVGRKILHCGPCKRDTIHTLEARCKGSWSDHYFSGGDEFSIYRCGACDHICFETWSWNSEDLDYDEDGNVFHPSREIQYPPPSTARFAFNTEHTPAELDALIGEMMYAFAGAKLVLTTVGLRLVIEFIVRDKDCPGKSLYQKIDALHTQGHINEQQRVVLQKLRKRGNAGAHEAASMSTRELVAGMGIVQILLEKLYNGPAREAALLRSAEIAFKDSP